MLLLDWLEPPGLSQFCTKAKSELDQTIASRLEASEEAAAITAKD